MSKKKEIIMPRTKEQNEKIRNKRIEEIKVIACEIYGEVGVKAFEMKHISEKTGLGRGTIYHYYSNKFELLKDIFSDMIMALEISQSGFDELDSNTEKLRSILEHHLDQFINKPYLARFIKNFRDEVHLIYDDQEMQNFNNTMEHLFYKPMDSLLSKIKPDLTPCLTGSMIWGAMIGAATIFNDVKLLQTNPEMKNEILNLIISGLTY
jgi:AcrR family transcriptional regulator